MLAKSWGIPTLRGGTNAMGSCSKSRTFRSTPTSYNRPRSYCQSTWQEARRGQPTPARTTPGRKSVGAVIPPVVRCTPALIIRKFTSRHYTVDDLITRGTLTRALAEFLAEQIRNGYTLLISGGTGTGKTTLSRILARLYSRTGSPCCHRGYFRTSDPEAEHSADGMPDRYLQGQDNFRRPSRVRSPLATGPHRSPTLPTLPDFGHGTRLAASLNGEKKAFSFCPDGRKTQHEGCSDRRGE